MDASPDDGAPHTHPIAIDASEALCTLWPDQPDRHTDTRARVRRDVKLKNVMLLADDPASPVVLVDFGLSTYSTRTR